MGQAYVTCPKNWKLVIYLKNFDWILFTSVILLVCFGLAEIYSVALGRSQVDLLNFKKQIVFIVLGVGLLFLLAGLDYYNLRNLYKNNCSNRASKQISRNTYLYTFY